MAYEDRLASNSMKLNLMSDKKRESQGNELAWQDPLFTKHQYVFGISLLVTAGLIWIDYRSAIIFAVSYFLFIIMIAPFLLNLAYFLPVINKASLPGKQITLTFDDGPDPEITSPLLELLAKHQIKVAFFVTGDKAKKYPQIVQHMVSEGHEIGNHTQHHDVFLMLRSRHRIQKEIEDCQNQLLKQGIRSFAFRPPVGITNPKLYQILKRLGMYCVGFSCRPYDFGNRKSKHLSKRILNKVEAGDIVLLHDSLPYPEFSVKDWMNEIELLIHGLKERRLQPVLLSKLIGRPLIKRIGSPEN